MYTLETAYQMVQNDPLFAFVRNPDGSIDTVRGSRHPFKSDGHLNIVPGSFNPLHDGHRALYAAARAGYQPNAHNVFEMSIDRYDKGTMDVKVLSGRLKQFDDYAPVLVMKHPLFMDKLGVLAAVSVNIHIGIDTALRIVGCHSTVGAQGLRATFYVYPRKIKDRIWTLSDLPGDIPFNFCAVEQTDETMLEISSTVIRREMGIAEIGLNPRK